MIDQRVYTMKEVAFALRIGRDKVYRLAKTNAFPVIQLGRQYFSPMKAFDAWLDNSDCL